MHSFSSDTQQFGRPAVKADATVVENSPILGQLLYSSNGQNYQYGIVPGILMSVIGVLLIVWFLRLDAKPLEHSAGQSWIAYAASRLAGAKNSS